MRKLIIALLLFSINGIAQEVSFQEIDSTTYALYKNENWKALANYEKVLASDNIDYYFYNIRLGIAHFNLGAYYKAEKYFKKAINNDSTDFAITYLYWSYINMGQLERAKEVYKTLTEDSKKQIKNRNYLISALYIEAGLKNSNNSQQDDLTYYSFSGAHRFSDKLSAVSNISFIDQKSDLETNNLYQWSLIPSFYLGKGSLVSIGYVYANNTYQKKPFFPPPPSPSQPPLWPRPGITSISSSHVITANYSKQFKRWNGEGFFQYVKQTNSSNLAGTSIEYLNNIIVGATFSYVLPMSRDCFSIGATSVYAFGSLEAFMVSPFVLARISPKLFFRSVYSSVDKFLYFDKYSNIFFRSSSNKTARVAGTLSYMLSPKLQVIGTYSHEDIVNSKSATSNYQFNSFFLGLNYKF